MLKYHKDIGFKRDDVILAQALIDRLKDRPFVFSRHSLGQLLEEKEAEAIGQKIKGYSLNWNDVFELVIDNGIVLKMVFAYRLKIWILFLLSIVIKS